MKIVGRYSGVSRKTVVKVGSRKLEDRREHHGNTEPQQNSNIASQLFSRFASHTLRIMKTSLAWTILIIAGFFETGWAIGMKYSDGFTKLWPSVFTAIFMLISVVMLTYSLKVLPVGSAYAVWTGIGAVGTVILGIFLFKEPYDLYRLFFIFLIIIGIIGLRVLK